MDKRRIRASLVLVLACIATSGCMSTGIRRAVPVPEKRLAVDLQDFALDFKGISRGDTGESASSNFLAALDSMLDLNEGQATTNRLQVSSLRVDASFRAGGAGPVVFSILSTPFFCFALKRDSCTAYVNISYVITDPAGGVKERRKVTERLRGWSRGWSFTRFAFRNGVLARMTREVPAAAAQILVDDILDSQGLVKKPAVRGRKTERGVRETGPSDESPAAPLGRTRGEQTGESEKQEGIENPVPQVTQ